MLTWCKLHTDVLGDAKLQRAVRKGARGFVVLPWLIVWARAHDETDAGRLVLGGEPADPEDVVAQIPDPDVTAEQVAACMASCEAIGVLERDADGVLRFAAWAERSGRASTRPSDRPEAVRERVRQHRERKRQQGQPGQQASPATRSNDRNALRNEQIEIEKERETRSEAVAEGQAGARDATAPAREPARDAAPPAPLGSAPLDVPAPLVPFAPLVRRLLDSAYADATPARRADVVRQLVAVLAERVKIRRGEFVGPTTRDVLARAIEHTLATLPSIHNRDRAILFVLRKCMSGDAVTPPDAHGHLPSEALAAREAAERAADDRELADREHDADAWLAEHPDERVALEAAVEAERPKGVPDGAFWARARAVRLRQLVDERLHVQLAAVP